MIPVDRDRKRELLSHLITSGRIDQALVFTRTKHGANRLAEQLGKDGISAAAIHGNKSQGQRVRALGDFKAGRVAILVATDIAARGLDIEQLPHVVNYELPMVAEDYVHRIGRTGRAGKDGEAISLVCVDERPLVQDIQALLRRPIPTETIAGFEPNRNIRPEPIRLRSTPAERAERLAARGPQPSGRGNQPSNRGGQLVSAGTAAASRSAAASPDGAAPAIAIVAVRTSVRRAHPSRAARSARHRPGPVGIAVATSPAAGTAVSPDRCPVSAFASSTSRADVRRPVPAMAGPVRSVAGPRRLVVGRAVCADEAR